MKTNTASKITKKALQYVCIPLDLRGILNNHHMYYLICYSTRYFKYNQHLFATPSRLGLMPTQPPIQGVLGASSPAVKRSGREDDYSLPSSAEVKNAWSYTTIPLHTAIIRPFKVGSMPASFNLWS
jgi:hypothetical protein